MTALDEALKIYIEDETQQSQYYELLLKTDFYIPIVADDSGTPIEERENVTPLVLESEGKPYVLMFDTEERVNSWAKEPIEYVLLAGYEMVNHTPAGLYWAINLGSQLAKEFVPEEIAYLQSL